MMVKKFEARTIKDAIELVKSEMGPDAIILSAKENTNGFGIMGGSSVEVSAAVSENRYRSKAATERKLDSRSLEKFKKIPARRQKEVIDRVLQNQAADDFAEDAARTRLEEQRAAIARHVPPPKVRAVTNVRYVDINDMEESASDFSAPPARVSDAPKVGADNRKIQSLQNEVQHLKSLLANFNKVPQNFMSLHPGAEEGLPYELSFAFQKLREAGVSHANTTDILKIANEVLPSEQKKKKAFVDGWLIKYFLDHMDIHKNPTQGKVHIFLGATGQGKTSTVIKMACHLIMNEKKKVALLTGDTVKVGATDQYKIFAQILNVPFGIINSSSQWTGVQEQLQSMDYILFDTPGLTLKSPQDVDRLRAVLPPNMTGMRTHYVQSALSRDQDAFELAERFQTIGFQDVIFTRLDEAVQHGIIYNFQKKFAVPLHSFGIGAAIPEDFEFATKERVADLIFNLSKFRK